MFWKMTAPWKPRSESPAMQIYDPVEIYKIRRFNRIDDASMSTGLRSAVINLIVGYKDEAPVRKKTFRIDSIRVSGSNGTEKLALGATQGTLR
jgi:hypothetical protein